MVCVMWMWDGEDLGHHSQLPVLSVSCCRSPRENGVKPAQLPLPLAACQSSGGTWQQLREWEAAQPGHPERPGLPPATAAAAPRQWRCGSGRMSLAGGGRTEAACAATSSRLSRPPSRRAGARGRSAASLWDTRIPPWLPTSSTFQA